MAYVYGTCTTGAGATGKYEVRISYSYTQDQAANTSTITAILQARANNSSYGTTADFYRYVNGSSETHSTLTIGLSTSWIDLRTYTRTVTHADDGTYTLSLQGGFYQNNVGGTYALFNGFVDASIPLTTIPRYAAITSFTATVNSPSTVSCSWATDKSCSAVYYSIDNGSSWSSSVGTGTSGSFTISGLTPGKTYLIKLKVKATDSGLETPTQTALSRTLWTLSTVTFASFNLGTDVVATITRASTTISHDIAVYMKNPDSSTYTLIKTYSGITGTTQTISFTSEELTTIYNLIPTKKWTNMKLTITTKIGSTSYGSTDSSMQNANVVNADPIFTDFEYIDTNTTTTTITGDSSKFIKGYSNAQITVSVANKATAQKGATMSTYSFENAGLTTPTPKTYSDVANVVETLNGVLNANLVVRATDSRGNNTAKTKTIGTFINYTAPTVTSKSITRTNNVDDETTLSFAGTYNNWTGLSQSNSIQHAKYRYRETGGTWSSYSSDLTLTTNTGGSYSYSGTIAGDLGASGFDTTKSFEIEIVITDRLSSVTPTNMTLNSAQPLIWKFKGLVGGVLKAILGIGKQPDTTLPHGSIDSAGGFYVNGVNVLLVGKPIGSLEFNVSGINPHDYLGGTWVAWGTGRVPVGINTSDASFNTVEETGGSKTYALASHTHTGPSHTHTGPSHVHTSAAHTHSLSDSAYAKLHHTNGTVWFREIAVSPNWTDTAKFTIAGATSNTSNDYGTALGGNTDSTTPGNTGSGGTGNTGYGGTGNTGSGGNATIDTVQPYIVCYMWKRTA